MESPFSEAEQRFVLTEIIKTSNVSPSVLLNLVNDANIRPNWNQMLLPNGRNMQSCVDAFEALRSQSPSSIYTNPQPASAPASSTKRKFAPELFDPNPSSGSKRRQSGPDPIAIARTIQPKPAATGSPQSFSPSIAGSSTIPVGTGTGKKRGRPSRADIEARNRDALRKGEMLAPLADPTPRREPAQMVGAEMGASEGLVSNQREILPSPRFLPILPMAGNLSPGHPIGSSVLTPTSEQRPLSAYEMEQESDKGEGKKRRGRATSKSVKPGESSFQVTSTAPHAPPYYDPVRSHTTPSQTTLPSSDSVHRPLESLPSQGYAPRIERPAPPPTDRSDT